MSTIIDVKQVSKKTYNLEIFQERLKNALRRADVSQTELAESLGLSKQAASGWMKGSISLDIAVLVARKLQVSMDYLFGLDDEPGDRMTKEQSAMVDLFTLMRNEDPERLRDIFEVGRKAVPPPNEKL